MSNQQTPLPTYGPAPSTTGGTTAFLPLLYSYVADLWTATETDAQVPVPCAGTFDLLLLASDTSPGGGGSYAFTIRKNGADTTLTAGLSGASTTNSDLIDSFTVVAGDLVCIKCVTTSSPSSLGNIRWHTRFTATASNTSICLESSTGTKGTTSYFMYPIQGNSRNNNTVITNHVSVMPVSGTFRNLYSLLTNAAPADVISVTMFKNGSATSLSTSYTATSVLLASDTTHSVTVVAGDQIGMQVVFTSGATALRANIGVEFDPTVDGQSLGVIQASNTADNLTRWYSFGGDVGGSTASEASQSVVIMACSVNNLYTAVTSGTAISSGTMVTTLRKNSANTALTATITSVFAQDTAHTVSTAQGDLINIQDVTSGVGAAVNYVSAVTFFVPGSVILFNTVQFIDNISEQQQSLIAIPF